MWRRRVCVDKQWRIAGTGADAGADAGVTLLLMLSLMLALMLALALALVKTLAIVAPARLRRHVVVPATNPFFAFCEGRRCASRLGPPRASQKESFHRY